MKKRTAAEEAELHGTDPKRWGGNAEFTASEAGGLPEDCTPKGLSVETGLVPLNPSGLVSWLGTCTPKRRHLSLPDQTLSLRLNTTTSLRQNFNNMLVTAARQQYSTASVKMLIRESGKLRVVFVTRTSEEANIGRHGHGISGNAVRGSPTGLLWGRGCPWRLNTYPLCPLR